MSQTKTQAKREARYRAQLKKCGFRSWKRANARRGDLIDRSVRDVSTEAEEQELVELQKLADFYLWWKTNDDIGRCNRRLGRLVAKLKRRPRR